MLRWKQGPRQQWRPNRDKLKRLWKTKSKKTIKTNEESKDIENEDLEAKKDHEAKEEKKMRRPVKIIDLFF